VRKTSFLSFQLSHSGSFQLSKSNRIKLTRQEYSSSNANRGKSRVLLNEVYAGNERIKTLKISLSKVVNVVGRCLQQVCNHAALPGHMHKTRLIYGPQLHMSSSVGWTIPWPPTEYWQFLKSSPFLGPQNLSSRATFSQRAACCTPVLNRIR